MFQTKGMVCWAARFDLPKTESKILSVLAQRSDKFGRSHFSIKAISKTSGLDFEQTSSGVKNLISKKIIINDSQVTSKFAKKTYILRLRKVPFYRKRKFYLSRLESIISG